jgi:hypothetical protein
VPAGRRNMPGMGQCRPGKRKSDKRERKAGHRWVSRRSMRTAGAATLGRLTLTAPCLGTPVRVGPRQDPVPAPARSGSAVLTRATLDRARRGRNPLRFDREGQSHLADDGPGEGVGPSCALAFPGDGEVGPGGSAKAEGELSQECQVFRSMVPAVTCAPSRARRRPTDPLPPLRRRPTARP